jgi:hypothetical protein
MVKARSPITLFCGASRWFEQMAEGQEAGSPAVVQPDHPPPIDQLLSGLLWGWYTEPCPDGIMRYS